MRVKLRNWTTEDLDLLVRYANNKRIADFLADGFPHPYTRDDGLAFIRRANSEQPAKILAVTADDHLAGSIGIFPETDIHRKNAAIAYWIAEPFWDRGIATAAIKHMVEYGFSTFEVTRIYAKPYGTNKGSHRALEKAGFRLEATLAKAVFKNGEYLDERIYAMTR